MSHHIINKSPLYQITNPDNESKNNTQGSQPMQKYESNTFISLEIVYADSMCSI